MKAKPDALAYAKSVLEIGAKPLRTLPQASLESLRVDQRVGRAVGRGPIWGTVLNPPVYFCRSGLQEDYQDLTNQGRYQDYLIRLGHTLVSPLDIGYRIHRGIEYRLKMLQAPLFEDQDQSGVQEKEQVI